MTPLSALYYAIAAEEAGLPDGVVNVVPGRGSEAGSRSRAPECAHVTFTGSTDVGRASSAAAEAVADVTLELGGEGPAVVFPDADLDAAARGVQYGIFMNAGQMCWAGRACRPRGGGRRPRRADRRARRVDPARLRHRRRRPDGTSRQRGPATGDSRCWDRDATQTRSKVAAGGGVLGDPDGGRLRRARPSLLTNRGHRGGHCGVPTHRLASQKPSEPLAPFGRSTPCLDERPDSRSHRHDDWTTGW